jgi:hypothetical protein
MDRSNRMRPRSLQAYACESQCIDPSEQEQEHEKN